MIATFYFTILIYFFFFYNFDFFHNSEFNSHTFYCFHDNCDFFLTIDVKYKLNNKLLK